RALGIVIALLLLAATPRGAGGVLTQIDHLVYATPDLQLGIDTAEQLFGVRATPGGQHPGEGTRNALIALGPTSYFEIIGPDPDQSSPQLGSRFGIDTIKPPLLTTWVAKGRAFDVFAAAATANGITLGTLIPGSGQLRTAWCCRGRTPIRESYSQT